ncbi:NUDIX domain-containing protein [uncultured Roseibium sp.]|uniref:NUDIX domain-containing protein n=1 Tax=uncultured Roseibium sp. TaxID=1936171 RepID=UPI0026360514|nr:NUDIX domain-containing protein [uncultured Roseibium sp.]
MQNTDYLRFIDQTLLSDNWGKLTRYRFEYLRKDGSWQEQIREAYDRGNGVTCLLYNPETGCVLLTRQFRLPVLLNGKDPFLIETPAGLLEGANPEDRMRSELIEETGYEVSALEHLFDVHMSPGSVTEFLSFYAGTYHLKDRVGDGGGEVTEGEDIEVMHVPLKEALKMIRSGAICDAKTIMLLQERALREFTP